MKRAVSLALAASLLMAAAQVANAATPAESATDATAEMAPPAPPGRERMAALLIRTGDVDASLADSLTELLITALLSEGRYELVGKEEVKSALGVEDELRALECINSTSCLAAMGSALDVARALVGSIGVGKDGTFILTLTLVNLVTGETENRFFAKVKGGLDEVTTKLLEITPRVATPRPKPGTIRVAASVVGANVFVDDKLVGTVPVAAGGIVPGKHDVRVVVPGYFTWSGAVPVIAGEETTVEAELEKDPLFVAATPSKRWVVGLTGTMAALAIITGTLGAVGLVGARSERVRADTDGISQATFERARADRNGLLGLGIAGFGASFSFAVVAGYFLIFKPKAVFGSRGRSSKKSVGTSSTGGRTTASGPFDPGVPGP